MKLKKNNVYVCLFIGICFFWTGAGYISWLYNLNDIVNASDINASVDMLTEVLGYLFQALGILFSSYYFKKRNYAKSSSLTISFLILDFVSICFSVVTSSFASVIISGYIMNFLHGVVASIYLFMLAEYVESNRQASTFGIGYSIGTLLSWLLSLLNDGYFLKTDNVLIVYFVCVLITIILVNFSSTNVSVSFTQKPCDKNNIILLMATLLLLCITKGLGFYFPMADISNGNISLEFTRLFYAVGLIFAGLINDYKRLWGGIMCISSLIVPFVLLLLRFSDTTSLYIWILGYLFTGAFAVYRIVAISDISKSDSSLFYLAPIGLFIGRIGDAFGSGIGIILNNRITSLIFICSVLFVATIIISFYLFFQNYIIKNNVNTENMDPKDKIISFSNYHDLSAREKEVFPLLLDGNSNGEISSQLYVSENTVKFHVRNILKKTGCTNRQELLKCFHAYK